VRIRCGPQGGRAGSSVQELDSLAHRGLVCWRNGPTLTPALGLTSPHSGSGFPEEPGLAEPYLSGKLPPDLGGFRKSGQAFPRLGLGGPRAMDKVAQIFNLLYRRFVIGRASDACCRVERAHPLQNAILRYGRLKIRATLSLALKAVLLGLGSALAVHWRSGECEPPGLRGQRPSRGCPNSTPRARLPRCC
jgi:hypothetical protein